MNFLLALRSSIFSFLYRNIFKPFFFLEDPEKVHDQMVANGKFLGRHVITRRMVASCFSFSDKKLEQDILGIKFSNPVGLAAGFDKNGELTDIIPAVGFGFEEAGSITLEENPGNPKPRLYRLPKSKGIVVNYGLPNKGVDAVLDDLSKKTFVFPIGISVAKTNSPKTVGKEDGIKDYVGCFAKVAKSNIGDYITINISCPNAYGGEPFTSPSDLNDLLWALSSIVNTRPVFVKMPADIDKNQLAELLSVCKKHKVKGAIISNLTKDRTSPAIDQDEVQRAIPNGGISGKPTFARSNELIGFAYQNFKNDFVIIGCGGVFSAEDAYKKIKAGASLIQLITGMIYEGPQLISQINHGLLHLLARDGFGNISEAIGMDNR